MIVTRLEWLDRYDCVLRGCKKAAEIMRAQGNAASPDAFAVGRHETDDPNMYYTVLEYAAAATDKPFEVHAKAADVQIMLEGEELMTYSAAANTAAIDSETDCLLLDGDAAARVTAKPGMAVIFLPGELHKPGLATAEGSQQVKKAVFKIAVDF